MTRVAAVAAVLVLGLAACGGDDESSSSGAEPSQSTAPEATTESRADGRSGERTTTGEKGQATPEGEQRSGGASPPASENREEGGGETGKLELDTDAPAPPPTAEQRARDLPRGAPKPKSAFDPQERQVYEAAEFFCRRAGADGMRRVYGIESSDPEDIAREAARRTYDRGGVEATYAGCLAGLGGAG